jgi:hypothetical protein
LGLKETTTIDLITQPLPEDPCKLVLYVIDDGSVSDPTQRHKLLISKLACYMQFVLSEDCRLENPGIKLDDVLVRVLCKVPPNQLMREVQAVAAKNAPDGRLRVAFEDYDRFAKSLKQ